MRGETRIISVTFEGTAQSYEAGHFTVPKKVRDALDLESDARVRLLIIDPNEKELFAGEWEMKSGPEIYGLSDAVKAGQWIIVTVSRA